MEFIDTHTHNYDKAYRDDCDEVIARAVEAGVTHLLQADVDSRERKDMFDLCRRHEGVLHPMLGLYPGSVDEHWREELDRMLPFRGREVVAVGEIGLDYHYGQQTAELQKEAFRTQLELASEWDLPVNIHLREAFGDFIAIMEECRHLHLRGNLHAYSGSAEFFRRVSRTGDWYVGIGGVVTFKNAGIARELLQIPLDRILLETDAPYLTPVPYRGERNESRYVPLVAAKVSELKGVGVEQVAAVTTASARALFGI